MSTTIDHEAWRCTHDDSLMCPEEGCTQADGCARDRGWDGTQPGPRNGETPEIPYPLMDEDGEHFWLPGHVDPTLMVLAAVVEQMIDVGPEEAMQLLVGGPTRRDMTVVSDRPVWAWSFDDQRRRSRELVESVEHVWMVEHPDDEERMVPCGPSHPGAQPFTHLDLV